jgi:hypothetical protein
LVLVLLVLLLLLLVVVVVVGPVVEGGEEGVAVGHTISSIESGDRVPSVE